MIEQLLLIMDRQCRMRLDGRTTIEALADALYRDTSPSGLHAVRQLLYRARKTGHRFDFPRTGREAGRIRRIGP